MTALLRSLLFSLCAVPAVATAASSAAALEWHPAEAPPQMRSALLTSTATGRTYRIHLSLPETPPPETGYPTLYVLDAHVTFAHAALLAREPSERGPNFGLEPGVVIGIEHLRTAEDPNPRADDFTPPASDLSSTGDPAPRQGGADRFLDFLENELKPRLRAEWRLDPRRQTLFGHSYGGLFALHTLFRRHEAFQRYVAASPSLWWNQRQGLAEADRFIADQLPGLKAGSALPQLLLTVGSLEQTPMPHHVQANKAEAMVARRMIDTTRELATRLTNAGLQPRVYLFEDENHGTARLPALNHAVRLAFAR